MDFVLKVLSNDTLVITLLVCAVVGIIEYLIPLRPIPSKHYILNFIFSVTQIIFVILAGPAISYIAAVSVRVFGYGLIDIENFGVGLAGGSVIALFISVFIADFFLYWYHRARHHKVLWPMHLVHHADEHMNVTSQQRTHFTEIILQPVFLTIPIAFLFKLPPVTIAALNFIPVVWEFFTHANIKLGFGRLWWLLVSPDFHRVHHSIEPQHHDKNFAIWFPIIDIAFGTAWKPQKNEYPATGVEGYEFKRVRDLYFLPFQHWYEMLRGQPLTTLSAPKPATAKKRKK